MQPYLKQLYDKPRPLVFAHRGAMAYAPMNTLAAFELAHEQGADGIELDVWLSQDDVPVVIHDFEVDNTTDGSGRVGSMTVAEIQALDAGSWYANEFAGQRIPTLAEVFDTIGSKLFINVELKSTDMRVENIVVQTIACIRQHEMSENVLVSSFNPLVVRRMRKYAPEIATGYLQYEDIPRHIRWLRLGTPYATEHPHSTQITPEFIAQAKRKGRYVNAWTVNDPDEAVRLAQMGVDGIITDNPDTILAALGLS